MDISKILRNAWLAVEAAELPEEVQGVAYRHALQHLLAGEQAAVPVPSGTSQVRDEDGDRGAPGLESDNGGTSGSRENEIYDRVAEHTGVPKEKIEKLLYLDDDGIRVAVPGWKLGKSNADRTRAVAQLITIARGFGLEEEETPLSLIRGECSRLKVYDSANFSTQISKLSGYVVNGSGSNRRLRIRSAGVQSFASLVGQLSDADG